MKSISGIFAAFACAILLGSACNAPAGPAPLEEEAGCEADAGCREEPATLGPSGKGNVDDPFTRR